MKCLIITLLFVGIYFISFAQNIKIAGKVSDEKSNAVVAATVSLISQDSIVIANTIADNSGNFELITHTNSSSCILRVSHIVFEDGYTILIPDKDTVVAIHLKEKSNLLNTIEIIGKKSLYEFQNEKLIVNINEIPNIHAYNLERLLQTLPGVNADGGLTLNGQAATIYIDGRKQTLNSSNISTVIHSMPVAAIEKIELIYSSGGVYDASDGAIINIVYKKQRVDGYYLSVAGSGGIYDKSHLDGESAATVMFKKKNVMFNSMLSYRNNYSTSQTNDTLQYSNSAFLYQDRNNGSRSNVYTGMFNLNWNVRNRHNLNFNFNFYDDFSNSTYNQQYILQTDNITRNVWKVKSKGNGDLWSGQVEYTSPDTLKNKFKASYGIIYGGLRNYRNTFEEDAKILYTDDEMVAHRHTLKFDYEHKFSDKTNLLLGLKTDLGQLNDDVIYTETFNSNRYPTSRFFGRENIYAGYARFEYKFNELWSANASLRSEHTYYFLDFTSQNINLTDSYTNLFPFLTVSYNSEKKNYQTSLSLGSSITRPDYEYMLPGLRYSNQYNYTKGNPELKPRTDYTVTWRNLFYQFINAYIGYNFGSNMTGLTAKNSAIDPLIIEREYQNIADLSAFLGGVNIYYKLLSDKLFGQLGGSMQYVDYKNPKNGFEFPQGKHVFGRGSLNATAYYQITSQWGINCQYYFYPEYENLISLQHTRWRMNAGMYYNSKKDNWSLSLDVYDIFRSDKTFTEMYFDGNYRNLHSYSNSRFVRFSFIMKFKSGEKIEDKAKTGSLEIDRFSTN
jgi:hypothetical protein